MKLQESSEASINITIFLMNPEKTEKLLLLSYFRKQIERLYYLLKTSLNVVKLRLKKVFKEALFNLYIRYLHSL